MCLSAEILIVYPIMKKYSILLRNLAPVTARVVFPAVNPAGLVLPIPSV